MTTRIDSVQGRTALLLCHCAGMVDLIAMPVWMEVLITRYGLGPQRAGALVSLFLLAAVVTSSLLAAGFTRRRARPIAVAGFAAAAVVFALSAMTTEFSLLCGLYVIGGAGVGCGLSMTHGSMGRSADPHRVFGMAGAAAGVFSIAFYAATHALVERHGGAGLFWLLGGVMGFAACVAALGFPTQSPAAGTAQPGQRPLPLSPIVWLAIAGVVGIALNQAIGTSFLQNIGLAREFGADPVQGVLIALGIVCLFPGPLAMLARGRLSTRAVLVAGPMVQIAVVMTISHSLLFWPYAVAGALCTAVQIFMHTFAFGFIAAADPSGRAAAASPAMLMTGSALGPFMAGSLVHAYGYESLGWAVAVIGLLASGCYAVATRGVRTRRSELSMVRPAA